MNEEVGAMDVRAELLKLFAGRSRYVRHRVDGTPSPGADLRLILTKLICSRHPNVRPRQVAEAMARLEWAVPSIRPVWLDGKMVFASTAELAHEYEDVRVVLTRPQTPALPQPSPEVMARLSVGLKRLWADSAVEIGGVRYNQQPAAPMLVKELGVSSGCAYSYTKLLRSIGLLVIVGRDTEATYAVSMPQEITLELIAHLAANPIAALAEFSRLSADEAQDWYLQQPRLRTMQPA
jgi:hypothetical protein